MVHSGTEEKLSKVSPWWHWVLYLMLGIVGILFVFVVVCAVVAILMPPQSNPFRVTDDILKTLITGLATIIGASTIGGFGMLTAQRITAKIEDVKSKAQAKLEMDKLAYQRESELFKQKTELYKTLYNTRIESAKSVSDVASEVSIILFENKTVPVPEDVKQRITMLTSRLTHISYSHMWLFPIDLKNALAYLMDGIDDYLNSSDAKEIKKAGIKIANGIFDVSRKISEMMLNHDLEDLVGNLKTSSDSN